MKPEILENDTVPIFGIDAVDEEIQKLALGLGAEELRTPCLIPAAVLERAEYAAAFPQLLMGACTATDPDQDPESLFEQANLATPDFFLSPAACYHGYAHLEGQALDASKVLTMKARCFRNEDQELIAGRRQIEFEMREIVLVGEADWIDERLETITPLVEYLATEWSLDAGWEVATDPFFMPRAGGKAHMQRLLGAKKELCLSDGLAVASINRHGTFFGERFSISGKSGAPAHTACVAFGLDRIQHQLEQ